MARNVLHSSLLNAGFSIVFQIFCRILTFGINAFIVRNVGREVLGIMNVRLLLLESTLLFLSREAIRRAALSATTLQKEKCSWAQLINQVWLTVPACVLLCLPCLHVWLNWLSSVDEVHRAQYRFGCYAIALSCILEQCAEAPVLVAQVFCFVRLKIVMDTIHIFVRSVIFLWIAMNNSSMALYAFSYAQLASVLSIVIGHYAFFYIYIELLKRHRERDQSKDKAKDLVLEYARSKGILDNVEDFPFTSTTQMLPGVLKNESKVFNAELQTLIFSFYKQGFLKQILTEGEKYVMSVSPVLSFSEQATYDVVNNLGSLAARFIFRPIEDSSYFYFTQTIARDVPLKDQDRTKVLQAGQVLQSLCLVVTSIGCLALTFGQSYAHDVLYLYGGADFVAGGLPALLLRWHCLAICFLAVNGITEGYMFATNTSQDINKYNYLMAIFSIGFLLLSYALTSALGPVGFIFANCINMFCRICYSTRFIWLQYRPLNLNPVRGLMVGKFFLAALLVAGLTCKYSMSHTSLMLWHFGIGFGAVCLCLVVWLIENRELVKLGWLYVTKRSKAD